MELLPISNNLYSKIKRVLPIACVDLILYSNNKVLLCKRVNSPAGGKWWIPRGRVHIWKNLEEAAHRKAKEELSIDVDIVGQVGTYDNIFPEIVHAITTVFLVKSLSDDIKLDSQHSTFEWFAWDKLPKLPDILLQELEDGRKMICEL